MKNGIEDPEQKKAGALHTGLLWNLFSPQFPATTASLILGVALLLR